MDFVSSITMFICVEWTDNLHELHISSSEQMLPYVAAADYGAYTVAIRKYLQVIKLVSLFPILVFFHIYLQITGLQMKREGIFWTPRYHFHPFHRHLDISQARYLLQKVHHFK